jgi:hypothetical protein
MEDHLIVVENFYRLNEDLMAPQQCEAAKKDYEYVLWSCIWRGIPQGGRVALVTESAKPHSPSS